MYSQPRRMPPKLAVAANCGLPPDVCYRCTQRRLSTQRAHIIDRWSFPPDTSVYVVDGLENIVPLCPPCHAEQPIFRPGDEELAWAWLDLNHQDYADRAARLIATRMGIEDLEVCAWAASVISTDKEDEWAHLRELRECA